MPKRMSRPYFDEKRWLQDFTLAQQHAALGQEFTAVKEFSHLALIARVSGHQLFECVALIEKCLVVYQHYLIKRFPRKLDPLGPVQSWLGETGFTARAVASLLHTLEPEDIKRFELRQKVSLAATGEFFFQRKFSDICLAVLSVLAKEQPLTPLCVSYLLYIVESDRIMRNHSQAVHTLTATLRRWEQYRNNRCKTDKRGLLRPKVFFPQSFFDWHWSQYAIQSSISTIAARVYRKDSPGHAWEHMAQAEIARQELHKTLSTPRSQPRGTIFRGGQDKIL